MGAQAKKCFNDAQFELDFLAAMDERWAPLDSVEESEEWSDQEVENLRIWFLRRNIRQIADRRGSKKSAKETWDWISSDEIGPFSFRICAEACDLDWRLLRLSLVILYQRMNRKGLAVDVDISALLEQIAA